MSKTDQDRIIVFPETNVFGGTERSVLALARWLHRQGLPHRILLYYDALDLAAYADFPLRTTVLNPPRNPAAKVWALRKYLASIRGPYLPLMSGIQAALHASVAKSPRFHTLMHDTPSMFFGRTAPSSLLSRVSRRVSDRVLAHGLSTAGKTIVTSEYLAEESQRLYGGEVVVARMGGLAAPGAFRLRPFSGSLRMLSVAAVTSNKRIDWMLASLAKLRDEGLFSRLGVLDWRLDVVGPAKPGVMGQGKLIADLRLMAAELGLAGHVIFHGFVSDEVLNGFYAEADLFLMPARQGYGIPAIEALSRGLPVLLHRESGVSDILLDTPWCFVMQGDAKAMTPVLERAIASVVGGEHLGHPPPPLPTEADWASEVARLCGWID